MNKRLFITLAAVVCTLPLIAQESEFSIRFDPAAEFPLPSSADYFSTGGSANITGIYRIGTSPFHALGGLSYHLAPIRAEKELHILAAQVGGDVEYFISPRISTLINAGGGYFLGRLQASSGLETGSNPFVTGGVRLNFILSPLLNISIGGQYRNYLNLYQGVSAVFGTSLYLRGREARQTRIESTLPVRPGLLNAKTAAPGHGLEIVDIRIDPLFPVFHNYYDDHPIGQAELLNNEPTPVSDVKVSVFVRQYMDSPKVTEIGTISPGNRVSFDLNALFTDAILSVTEGTKAAAEISIDYRIADEPYRADRVETVRLFHRNAMTWDDDRKAGAFVTARDPSVLLFSKHVAGQVRNDGPRSLDRNLLNAMAIHEAMSLYGVDYVIDPASSYAEFSRNGSQVDFLQFPRQTLSYKAGDCDDLSILYCALLESVGIETAFITVPGHIYAAFRTDVTLQEATRVFSFQDELLFQNDSVWIPVEVTERSGGFLAAWEVGAREWREAVRQGKAGFIPLHDAWGTYEPVGLPGGVAEMHLPAADTIVAAYRRELSKYISREVNFRAAQLQDELRRRGENGHTRNRLGVLYARYGMLDRAESEFRQALKSGPNAAALTNLGNISYLNEEWRDALVYFERALTVSPGDAQVHLAIARTHHRLEEYGAARAAFDQVGALDSELAERYSYLAMESKAGTRAAEIEEREGAVLWNEE